MVTLKSSTLHSDALPMAPRHSTARIGDAWVDWTGGDDAERVPDRGPTPVEWLARFLRRKLGPGLQQEIARECQRALREGRHDFPTHVDLPSPYGTYLPERVVELLLARLSYEPGMKVLDVGHANGMECHRAMLRSLPGPHHLTGIDIAQPAYDTSAYYLRSVQASIGAAPFGGKMFDLIWCISSLEHIGMDNSGYVQKNAARETTPEAALSEMMRLLRPGGRLLITVPYGRYEDHGWFRTFDEAHLQRLLEPLRPRATIQEFYYEHRRRSGWKAVEPALLRTVGYRDQGNAGAAALAAVLVTRAAR